MAMTFETLVWLIPLPPLLAFFLIVLLTNRNKTLSHTIAVGAALLSWVGSMVVFIAASQVEHLGEHPFTSSINWLPTGDTWLRIGVQIDPFSAATLFFVAWTVLMIFIYSVGYHNFGQPKGELWFAENCEALGVPACVQLGASFDFVAGRVQRAPRWMQRAGLEWLYRVSREPRRMIPRYWADAIFLAKVMLRKAARRDVH